MTSRPYLQMIHDSVTKEGVTFEAITPDHIYRVNRGDQSFLMYDTELGLNNSSSAKIALYKSSTYDVLKQAHIPSVEHVFLNNPQARFRAVDPYQLAAATFLRFQEDVVIKPDNGSQGKHVYRVRDARELSEKLDFLFSLELNVAISPYLEAATEYRIVTLCGQARIALAKEKTSSWKHNLVLGAASKEVSPSKLPALQDLASRTAGALGLHFCSVDILETNQGFLVIEVNDKVMLDEYRKQDEPNRKELLSALYRDAILQRFAQITDSSANIHQGLSQ